MYLIFTFREFKSIHKGKTAILHLCFGTEKNRRLGSKKARYNRAFRRRHLFCLHIMVGEGGFEPPKSLTTDLQSAPFGHSGILPYLIEPLVKKWSWWTDSNPRPADYKSAALPAELYQHLSNEQIVYYQTSIRLSTGNLKKEEFCCTQEKDTMIRCTRSAHSARRTFTREKRCGTGTA